MLQGKYVVSWEGAPKELLWWQTKAKRNIAKLPTIDNPQFGASVRGWWNVIQPEWRLPDLSCVVPVGHAWFEFKAAGPEGLYLVIMAMALWLRILRTDERAHFENLAKDMTWFLRQFDDEHTKTLENAPKTRKRKQTETSKTPTKSAKKVRGRR